MYKRQFVWDLGDLGVGLMTIFNMLAIIPLSGQAISALRDYEQQYMMKDKKVNRNEKIII